MRNARRLPRATTPQPVAPGRQRAAPARSHSTQAWARVSSARWEPSRPRRASWRAGRARPA
eukprot:scaffold138612_cov133-Phaeocystis_antarctica.AAC.1